MLKPLNLFLGLLRKVRVSIGLSMILIISLGLLGSCSQVRSGKYVKIGDPFSLSEISKQYDISRKQIQSANPGKSLERGQWIFIPLKRGLIALFEQNAAGAGGQLSGGWNPNGELLWPVPRYRKISSFYGRRWGKRHEGIDIRAPKGSKIVAAESGRVVYSGWMGGYGLVVIISHGDSLHTVYAHARKTMVKKGNWVKRGQVIAKVGMTGRTTGPHLHFEVRHNNKAVDPVAYLFKDSNRLARK